MTRSIKIIVSDGREEIIDVPAGPNAHTRAHVFCTLRLRGETVRYEELIDGAWKPYTYDAPRPLLGLGTVSRDERYGTDLCDSMTAAEWHEYTEGA